jgi:hypothetical protein
MGKPGAGESDKNENSNLSSILDKIDSVHDENEIKKPNENLDQENWTNWQRLLFHFSARDTANILIKCSEKYNQFNNFKLSEKEKKLTNRAFAMLVDKLAKDVWPCLFWGEDMPTEKAKELLFFLESMSAIKIPQEGDEAQKERRIFLGLAVAWMYQRPFLTEGQVLFKIPQNLYENLLSWIRLEKDSACIQGISWALVNDHDFMSFYLQSFSSAELLMKDNFFKACIQIRRGGKGDMLTKSTEGIKILFRCLKENLDQFSPEDGNKLGDWLEEVITKQIKLAKEKKEEDVLAEWKKLIDTGSEDSEVVKIFNKLKLESKNKKAPRFNTKCNCLWVPFLNFFPSLKPEKKQIRPWLQNLLSSIGEPPEIVIYGDNSNNNLLQNSSDGSSYGSCDGVEPKDEKNMKI